MNYFYETYDKYERRGNIQSEKYTWLTKNANKMQILLDKTGIITYVDPSRNYSVPNYHLIINILPKFRQDSLHYNEVVMVEDSLIRYNGILEEWLELHLKELNNPFHWFKYGFKEFFGLPLYIINWFGIISDKTVTNITSNIIFKVLSGVGGLVTFISGIVTILQGKDQMFKFIELIFNNY